MDPKTSFHGQSMLDIVFNNRNKFYGAYFLRRTYKQHLLKAMTLAIGLFIFGLYTPKMAGALGLFKGKVKKDTLDSTVIDITDVEVLIDLPKKDTKTKSEKREKAQIKDTEIAATKDTSEYVATKDEKHDKESGTKNITGVDSGTFLSDGTTSSNGLTDPIKATKKLPDAPDVVSQVEFIGGINEFNKFIQSNLVYPEFELMYEEEGETEITFTVNADGNLENVKVSKSSGNEHFDKEALRLIRLCNKMFKPHNLNGKAIRSICSTTITFTVEN